MHEAGSQFTCFTGTKVQILTQKVEQCGACCFLAASDAPHDAPLAAQVPPVCMGAGRVRVGVLYDRGLVSLMAN